MLATASGFVAAL